MATVLRNSKWRQQESPDRGVDRSGPGCPESVGVNRDGNLARWRMRMMWWRARNARHLLPSVHHGRVSRGSWFLCYIWVYAFVTFFVLGAATSNHHQLLRINLTHPGLSVVQNNSSTLWKLLLLGHGQTGSLQLQQQSPNQKQPGCCRHTVGHRPRNI